VGDDESTRAAHDLKDQRIARLATKMKKNDSIRATNSCCDNCKKPLANSNLDTEIADPKENQVAA
jgi:hypothetical protein